MGVLLRNDLHTRYDLFDWSLHYKVCELYLSIKHRTNLMDKQEGTYYVHVFGARDMIDSNLHGKAIEPTRFSHQLPESDRPNSFHFVQLALSAMLHGSSARIFGGHGSERVLMLSAKLSSCC